MSVGGETVTSLDKQFEPKNYVCASFSAIDARSTLQEAIPESKKALARYTDPNILSFWLSCMAFVNHLAPDRFISFIGSWFSQSFYQLCFSNMRGPTK